MLKSKTFWAGLVSVVSGIGLVVQGEMADGAQLIVTGLLAIFLKDAINKK
jgi:hypothetical protein